MKAFSKYLFITLTAILFFTMTSCDDKDEVEYNLPGNWYTYKTIDYGGSYYWGTGTVMTFNDDHQGTIGYAGDNNYLVFEWRWISGYKYDTNMELYFYRDRSYAYIEAAQASSRIFSGVWYNNKDDFRNRVNGQEFIMRRDR